MRLLLEAGADKNLADNNGCTALMMAWTVEAMRLLLDAGASTDLVDNFGNTALMVASSKGHVERVRLLLDAGAKKDVANDTGSTALSMAISQGHSQVELLLRRGSPTSRWQATTTEKPCPVFIGSAGSHEGRKGCFVRFQSLQPAAQSLDPCTDCLAMARTYAFWVSVVSEHRLWFRVFGFRNPGLVSGVLIVEARKLEHQYPHALKLEYRGSWHQSS